MASGVASEEALSPGAAEAFERLYAAPLESFVALRREIASALRKSGDSVGARKVMNAAKPSRTAWALNQVARARPDLLREALAARTKAAASAARSHVRGDPLRDSVRAFRDRLADVVQAASEVVGAVGAQLSPEQGRRIGATVQAVASGGDPVLRETFLAGRLTNDVELDDPFAGLEVSAAGSRAPSAGATTPTEKASATARATLPDNRHARHNAEIRDASRREEFRIREAALRARELEEAGARIAILEDEAKKARAQAREAETLAFRAQAEAERLRRAVKSIEAKLQTARRSLDP